MVIKVKVSSTRRRRILVNKKKLVQKRKKTSLTVGSSSSTRFAVHPASDVSPNGGMTSSPPSVMTPMLTVAPYVTNRFPSLSSAAKTP